MTAIQISSVRSPFDKGDVSVLRAVLLLSRGEVMGFFRADEPVRDLGPEHVQSALAGLAERGVGRVLLLDDSESALVRALEEALALTEDAPMPDGEWAGVVPILGDDLVLSMLGIGPASLRRYASGQRVTPDGVAARLHVLALLVADLNGSYNDFGIRRWFTRVRPQLDGRSPAQVLRGDWDPDSEDAGRVRALAAELVGVDG